ncbi:DUF1304 domain-containing protein [Mariniflexile sp.]|uniref:DUF1304 domain-containing protein n=1 Tax=Mariniflexile sp. TaxID=1979402 RepID=UPI00356658B7
MTTFSILLVSFVALEHVYFLILEMFFWTTPKGIKTFGLKTKSFAEETKILGANQGLYNGFLSAGLVFSLSQNNISFTIFFLICVILAGIYGAYSTKQIKIFYAQAIPALIAFVSIFI